MKKAAVLQDWKLEKITGRIAIGYTAGGEMEYHKALFPVWIDKKIKKSAAGCCRKLRNISDTKWSVVKLPPALNKAIIEYQPILGI